MTKKYLRDCLDQFPEVSQKRFGYPFDMQTIENDAEPLRSQAVSVRDIHEHFRQYFKDNHTLWWFNQYWLFPNLHDLAEAEQEKTFCFDQLSKGNEGSPKEILSIEDLLKAFRQIELVSIILRFICPVSFGILSPPVEHVLATSRGKTAVETYRNYLKDLRSIRDEYKFDTAAEADMALWVLKHKCYDENMKDEEICRAFNKDDFMLQLRAKNFGVLISNLSSAQLATAFSGVSTHLAALVGCYALEENAKKLVAGDPGVEAEAATMAKKKEKRNEPQNPSLGNYLDALKSKRKITEDQHTRWKDIKKIRDRVFHADSRQLTPQEVQRLIKTVWEIEQCVRR